ncbi:hypothetical protein [Streptomyces sp. N35]|uniref:hypothetical protein n=1 Tax=Streptomyces sp. N35 TaxID=2795730 RepID=UPI0018F6C9A1|nr:hypothetical protein [Streptomyces sp. N35]
MTSLADVTLASPEAADLAAYVDACDSGLRTDVLFAAQQAMRDSLEEWEVRGLLVDEVLATAEEHIRTGYVLGMCIVSKLAAAELRQRDDVMALAYVTGVAA